MATPRAVSSATAASTSGTSQPKMVKIWAEKSPDVVVAMQAVLVLGAAYVPVDPASPVARTSAVVRDCARTITARTGGAPPGIGTR